MRDIAYIALGSNMGDRHAMLAAGRAGMANLPGSRIVAQSSIEETAPIGPVDQPSFLNQMVALETSLSPRELLRALLDIETTAGRVRDVRWGPRTLDLDIVRFGRYAVNEPNLQIPHPELTNRLFWQRELDELAPMVARAMRGVA